ALDGERPVAVGALRDVGEPARERAPRQLGDRPAVEAHDARRRREHAGERAYESRLARAVGADEPDQLARGHRDVDPVDDAMAAERDADVARAEKGHGTARLVRSTRNRKNGAPISAVTTPSFSSGPAGSRRTTMSAASSSAAPPNALAGRRRPG